MTQPDSVTAEKAADAHSIAHGAPRLQASRGAFLFERSLTMTTEIQIVSKDDLQGLAVEIRQEHDLCRKAISEALQHAINAGELLLKAKTLTPHGTWSDWVRDNCEFSERTAQAYMRVARGLPVLEAKAQRVADLSFRDALMLLSEPEQTEYDVHELGQIFPMMTESEFSALVEDIRERGLLHPITLYEGKILDGKCRYEACKVAGVRPTFNQFPEDYPGSGDAFDFVMSCNLHRQSISEDQRAAMAVIFLKRKEELAQHEAIIECGLNELLKQSFATQSWADLTIDKFMSRGLRISLTGVEQFPDDPPMTIEEWGECLLAFRIMLNSVGVDRPPDKGVRR